MTKPGENISLILYEFKLQDMEICENMISLSDYGSYVVNFLEDTFDCSFSTLTATSSSKVEIFHINRFIYKRSPNLNNFEQNQCPD